MMNKKEKKEYAEGAEFQEEMNENSGDSETFAKDMTLTQVKNYPSDVTPQDMYQYKKLRINPEALADYPGLVDKDFVLANMSGEKPNLQQKRFEVGTFNLVKSVFVTDVVTEFYDKYGNLVIDEETGNPFCVKKKMFDPQFEPILDFLKGDIKSELVGSRALGGNTREAVLDVTTNLSKTVEKKKERDTKQFGLA